MRRLLNLVGSLLSILVIVLLVLAFVQMNSILQNGDKSSFTTYTQQSFPLLDSPLSSATRLQSYPPPGTSVVEPQNPITTCDAYWPTPPAKACPWLPTPTLKPTSPFPTRTPWIPPTPQVPASTPLALPLASSNPAGELLFRGASFQSIGIDEKGKVESTSQVFDIQPDTDFILGYDYPQFDCFFPSPGGGYVVAVAEVETGEIVIVIDSKTRESSVIYWSNNEGKVNIAIGFFYGWHPNGYEFLFRADNSSEQGLWLVDAATSQHRLIAQPLTLDISGAAVSPDGQRLVYATNTFDVHQIWTANVDGSEPRLLLESNTIVYVYSWSPDGRYLLYVGEPNKVVGKGTPVPNSAGPLWVMDREGENRRPLSLPFIFGFGFKPAWSPAGHHVAGVGGTDEYAPCWQSDDSFRADLLCLYRGTGVYIEDIDTGVVKLVSRNAIDPAWSPDGSLLAMSLMDEREQVDIWLVNVDGSEMQRVMDTPELDRNPVWLQQ